MRNLRVLVHRKGSTRCFGPRRKEIPQIYRKIGQPVIVGGSMERAGISKKVVALRPIGNIKG
ncbi:MAG: hypothetical protein EPN24_03775 [Candidatus Methanoperedens sp.]|nr:MAG: hypothetical protein EPN24_03775 [Candidatus Methanoperedens sp.]